MKAINPDILLYFLSIIITVGGAGTYLKRLVDTLMKPLKEPIEKHSKQLEQVEKYLENDYENIKDLNKHSDNIGDAVTLLMKNDLIILEHLETNNATKKMTAQRHEIRDFLLENNKEN